MAVDRVALEDLVTVLYRVQMRYWQARFGRVRDMELGPPATEGELVQLEQLLGGPIPESYRAFLELHNGWKNFSGDAHIISIADRQSQHTGGSIEAFKRLGVEEGDDAIKHAFVVVGSDASQYLAFFDMKSAHNGEMDVVEWTYERGEIARHPDFARYLQHQLRAVESLLAEEENRPPRLET